MFYGSFKKLPFFVFSGFDTAGNMMYNYNEKVYVKGAD